MPYFARIGLGFGLVVVVTCTVVEVVEVTGTVVAVGSVVVVTSSVVDVVVGVLW
jgi:hypothetical protein